MKKIDFEVFEKKLEASGFAKAIPECADNDALVVSGVPEQWRDAFADQGFREYACYQDYWVDALTPSDSFQSKPIILRPDECAAASGVSIACRNHSRGFEGESPEWFDLWLSGKEEGQVNSKCKNPAVLVHNENDAIAGIVCTATYAHDSEKGAVVWIRMLAVHPDLMGRGIGKKLLSQALQYGLDNGAIRAFLHVDVQNDAAIRIYQNAGFLSRAGEIQTDMIWRANQ